MGRLTVIDGECCSASLLQTFKNDGRDLVVPLPAPMIKPERFSFGPGSAFRPYREGDRIREGSITLQDSKNRNVTVEARAIIIERRTKETWTVLVTLADEELWSARRIADAYFGRWPHQEGFFRLANQAVGLKQVHGYGKRVVTNTAVVTELEQLDPRIEKTQQKQVEETQQSDAVKLELSQVQKELRKVSRYRAKREERVDECLDADQTDTKRFADASAELRQSSAEERKLDHKMSSLEKKQQRLTSKLGNRKAQLVKWERNRKKLASRTEIVEADVAKDTLFTAMKLTLGMLVHFVAVEYFPHRPLQWSTFLSRIAMLPGRRETTEDTITVFIYGNERDLKLMKALEIACHRINKRDLVRDGFLLRYELEWPDGPPEIWSE